MVKINEKTTNVIKFAEFLEKPDSWILARLVMSKRFIDSGGNVPCGCEDYSGLADRPLTVEQLKYAVKQTAWRGILADLSRSRYWNKNKTDGYYEVKEMKRVYERMKQLADSPFIADLK